MSQKVYEEADFCDVLELMPLDVRRTLTFEQRAAISKAVVEARRKHTLDVRIGVPLLFTQLYFVLFVGKDTRQSTQQKLSARRIGWGQWGTASLVGALGLCITFAGLAGAYLLKSRAGINILSDMHAKDVLRSVGIW